MQPYYELNIEYYDLVKSEIVELFDKHLSAFTTNVYFIHQDKYNDLPNLNRMLRELNITNPWYMIVIVNGGDVFDPHLDFYGETQPTWSLLLPIQNTENTATTFHECPNPPYLKTDTNKLGETKTWWALDLTGCKMTHAVSVVVPTLINVQTPHGVLAPNGNGQRITLSISIPVGYDPLSVEQYFLKR